MSGDPASAFAQSAAEIRSLHEARARAEIAQAHALCPGADVVPDSGAVLAEVVLVKGLPGPAEAAGGATLSGSDGEAADKALIALGWPAGSWFATLSHPQPDMDADGCAQRLRMIVEAVDPRAVAALDPTAAQDLARAFGLDALKAGRPVRVLGRTLVALDEFEASLADEARKRRAWTHLKAIAPPGPVY